ncbi:YdeI/OmpD-associated family protein [Mucilaginibacter sp. UR6-11]|uniref:YdeI/OmpD-associated family protein n=1 Tax=Mucilaginibacter sp. UR6-11 TaxID=1435644 RepID=UPI001E3FC03C|nr:YdeI/OmpD-associated family protein [Mucilaginibacter sp. UR6-11]MCC8427050.1 YdeI/OmpD-associated family protein [Mucilaginibacter sp. UR6-11]
MSPLAKKLLIKPGAHWLLFNAPANYFSMLEPLPDGVLITYRAEGQFDGVQLFVKKLAELASSLKIVTPVLQPQTIFWIIYPKKSSGVKSDLEMMGGWTEVEKYGLRIVASAAIDDTWTALRFRPQTDVKISESRNDNIKQNDYSAYIDVDNKQVKLPAIIADTLEKETAAMDFYQSLSYSNKKEYVLWILTAKQDKTRHDRLIKMVEKLNTGKKNPSEK